MFCDQGVFTVDEARRILVAAREHGMGLRLHAEEIARTGAAGLAAELGCASADHLEHVSAARRRGRWPRAGVVAVLLPTVTLSLRSQAWGHAAVLRDAGVELALATDCNPGTSWCESMPYAMQLACLAMGLSVDEALRAATLGAAHSLRRDDVGHLGVGAHGDLAVLAAEHEADLVAHLGGARSPRPSSAACRTSPDRCRHRLPRSARGSRDGGPVDGWRTVRRATAHLGRGLGAPDGAAGTDVAADGGRSRGCRGRDVRGARPDPVGGRAVGRPAAGRHDPVRRPGRRSGTSGAW